MIKVMSKFIFAQVNIIRCKTHKITLFHAEANMFAYTTRLIQQVWGKT